MLYCLLSYTPLGLIFVVVIFVVEAKLLSFQQPKAFYSVIQIKCLIAFVAAHVTEWFSIITCQGGNQSDTCDTQIFYELL